jgi:hypothetical protein
MNAQAPVTQSDLLKIIADQKAALDAMQAKLDNAPTRTISLKVGSSGTVCLYHGAKYPVALYRSQWERVIPFIKSGAIERFIEINAALLKADKA